MQGLFSSRLAAIAVEGNLRKLPQVQHRGEQIIRLDAPHKTMLNLSSNDYMGLASNKELIAEFETNCNHLTTPYSASSSRLLTGNFELYGQLEDKLCQLYNSEAALVFNSGYHANIGILPAITSARSLIVADKLIHASLIDGARLCAGKLLRFLHNDLQHLEQILSAHAAQHDLVVVVVESIYSMDGDCANLPYLVGLKKRYPNLILYVDEAHAVGAMGATGLGYSEQCGCVAKIDILVGTFGKALASVGAYAICNSELKEWLVNKMRPLIFSTALPPINLLWTLHVLEHLAGLNKERQHLARLGKRLRAGIGGTSLISCSHIVPLIVGDSELTVALAQQLQNEGFYLLPVRPPTVPKGTSRLRISLNSAISMADLERLISIIRQKLA